MFQFGNQVEFRVDRRHLLFLGMGAILWTFLVFFLGMWTIAESKKRPIEQKLRLLGWLDQQRPEDPAFATLSASQRVPASGLRVATSPQKPQNQPSRAATASRIPPPTRDTEPSEDNEDNEDTAAPAAPAPRSRTAPPARRLPQETAQASRRTPPPTASKAAEAAKTQEEAKKQHALQRQIKKIAMVPSSRAQYTLQLRFSSDLSTLQRIHQRLLKKGYSSATLTREVFRQKRYFRLTIGSFRTPQQAQHYMRLFQQAEGTKTTLHKLTRSVQPPRDSSPAE
ncbi:SPOR domain-containing protein [Myxococcota bacterium]|nr:SPOR domain-containing protein [Myxococcota bacterium]